MVRDNEMSALKVHIEVNGQNLSAIQEKCNVSTLRVPSDPSWPKIPQRRLTDDVIKPPCVITLTGTPRRSRSIVRSAMCQHPRSRINNEYETNARVPKRSPGCVDPRFRRKIPQAEAEKPDESRDAKSGSKQADVELNTCVPSETKKHEDNTRRMEGNGADGETQSHRDIKEPSGAVDESTKKTADHPVNRQCTLQADYCANALTNERLISNVEGILSQEQKAEANMPLLLMVDEKKLHALPINGLNIEAAPSSAQCYSVQIPVVAYRNVPLEMPNISKRVQAKAKIRDNARREETASNCSAGMLVNLGICGFEGSENVWQSNARNENALKTTDILHCDDKESVNWSVSTNRQAPKSSLDDEEHHESCTIDARSITEPKAQASRKSEITVKRGRDNSKSDGARIQQNVTRSHSASFAFERKGSSEKVEMAGIAENCIRPSTCSDARRRKLVHLSCVKENMMNGERPMENVQLSDKLNDENNAKWWWGESRGNLKRKMVPLSLSRKAKSFFRKKTRLAITDSDCTLLLPGPRHVKGKQCEKARGCLRVRQLLHRRNGVSSANSIRLRPDATPKLSRASRSSAHRADNLFERSPSIPLKTQELLNKSYWEYYRKLQWQIALTKPEDVAAKGKCNQDESRDPTNLSPESQTLRQCSVLSCMINNTLETRAITLRDSVEPDKRSITDPVVRESIENNCRASGLLPTFAKRIKRKKPRRVSKRLLRLKNIAFLGVMMYIAIIFLSTIYDYFFDEEYDDNENANYVALALDYAVSSFEEAFGGITGVLSTAFLRPVRFSRKL